MSPTQAALPAHLSLQRHFLQENGTGIRGTELKANFEALGQLDRCVCLEDEEVQSWIHNPASYPEELKSKKVLLLTSESCGSDGFVASLVWQGHQVQEEPAWLQQMFGGDCYVLLRTR